MPEFDPTSSRETSVDDPEHKSRRRRRKSREAATRTGRAATESLIWQREEPKPKKAAKDIAEALKGRTRKEEVEEKEADVPASVATEADTPSKVTEQKAEAVEDEADDAEAEAKLAELTPDEVHHAAEEYVQVRGMEVTAEQVGTEPDSAESAALEADAALLAAMRHKLEADPQADPEQALDEAYAETVNTLPPEEAPEEAELPMPDAETETASAAETSESTPDHNGPEASAEQPPVVPPQPPEHAPHGTPEEPEPSRTVVFPPIPPAGAPPTGEYVPTPPEERFGPLRNVISVEEAAHYERRAETRGLLIGGLVGYFIGRRRGRIKTEKRLLPVQEKLEKQVKTLHETIADKEFQIRQLAARRHVQAKRQATQERPKPAERPPVHPPEAAPVTKHVETHSAPVVEVQRRPLPETPRYVEQVPAGPMVQVAAEVAAATAAMTAAATEQVHREQPAERLPATPPPSEAVARDAAADRVKHMSRRQLLAASEQVVISGERLRDVYESKRISETGLRNVMIEHARGGDAEKLLKQEILNKEMSYERDPQLRKRLTSGVSAAGHGLAGAGAAAGAATANLAHKAAPKVAATAERTKDIGKKVVQQAVNTGKKLDDPGKPLQQVIVRTWATVTILLAIIAIILLFR